MRRKEVYLILAAFIIIVCVILYLKTDLLKTKEQLFWKYLLKEKDEIINVLSNEKAEQYNKKLNESFYTKEGNVSIEGKNKLIKPINVKISEKGNKEIDCKNISLKFDYNKENIGNVSIIKDDNYYLIKNELSDTDYIGIENNNLKQIAKDYGVKNIELIPNKIKEIDWFDFFKMNDSDLRYILKKYIPICRKYVKNKDYIKKNNIKLDDYKDNLTIYELELSEEQIDNIIIDILDNLYNDDRTLKIISNKIKIIDRESEYCDIYKLKEKFKEMSNFLCNKKASNEKFLSIIIYKNKNNVIKAEFVLKNNRTFSIEKNSKNEIVLKQYNIINRKVILKNLSGILETFLNCISEVRYTKEIENIQNNKVEFNIICDFGIESLEIKYNYVEQIQNTVEELIRKNDIKYIDIKKYNRKMLSLIFENMLKIDNFDYGKNYYQIF